MRFILVGALVVGTIKGALFVFVLTAAAFTLLVLTGYLLWGYEYVVQNVVTPQTMHGIVNYLVRSMLLLGFLNGGKNVFMNLK